VGALPNGTAPSQYLSWDGSSWVSQGTSVRLGNFAGTSQGYAAIAIGLSAGALSQRSTAIALGLEAGNSNQGVNAVAIGAYAGAYGSLLGGGQGTVAVAVGSYAGNLDQKASAVAVGESAGSTSQGLEAVAVGSFAGAITQGSAGVAVGKFAGYESQGSYAVAIGFEAGKTSQVESAVAIGYKAGRDNQGQSAIAIGSEAATTGQGDQAIAIGNAAGNSSTYETDYSIAIGSSANGGNFAIVIGTTTDGETSGAPNSIVLNATGSGLASTTSGFVVAPVRASDTSTGSLLQYNATTSEVTTVAAPSFARSSPLGSPTVLSSAAYTNLSVSSSATIQSQPPSSVVAVTVTAFVSSAAPVHVYVSFTIATGATVHVDAADDNALILRADGDGAASATLTHVLPGSVTYPCTVVPWARVVGSGLCTLNSVQLLVHLL
jgi:hypothetical protein